MIFKEEKKMTFGLVKGQNVDNVPFNLKNFVVTERPKGANKDIRRAILGGDLRWELEKCVLDNYEDIEFDLVITEEYPEVLIETIKFLHAFAKKHRVGISAEMERWTGKGKTVLSLVRIEREDEFF